MLSIDMRILGASRHALSLKSFQKLENLQSVAILKAHLDTMKQTMCSQVLLGGV